MAAPATLMQHAARLPMARHVGQSVAKTAPRTVGLSSRHAVASVRPLLLPGGSIRPLPRPIKGGRAAVRTTAILAPGDWEEEGEGHDSENIRCEANNRLLNIMRSTGTMKEEAIANVFNEIPLQEDKLCLYMMMCSGLGGFSILLTLINDTDPFGGMNSDMATLYALGFGLVGALPLILLHIATWSEAVRERFPVLDVVLEKDRDVQFPLIQGFSGPQLAAYVLSGSIPATMLVHTVVQGGLTQSFRYYFALMGFEAPEVTIALGCLGCAGFVAVLNSSLGHGATARASTQRQREVLGEAVANADRFYRVQTSAGEASAGLAAEKARVFKEAAEAHLAEEELMVTLGPLRAAAEAFVFSLLYASTANMATPLMAVTAYHLCYTYHMTHFNCERD